MRRGNFETEKAPRGFGEPESLLPVAALGAAYREIVREETAALIGALHFDTRTEIRPAAWRCARDNGPPRMRASERREAGIESAFRVLQ